MTTADTRAPLTVEALKKFLMRLDETAEVFVETDHCGEWFEAPVFSVSMAVTSDGYERITINVDH